MKEEQVAQMYEYATDTQDGRTTTVKLSADEMIKYLDTCFYGSPGSLSYRRGSEGDPETAVAYLEALKKLKYDNKAIVALKKYFKSLMAAEELRQEASRGLSALQDMRYERGSKNREKTARVY